MNENEKHYAGTRGLSLAVVLGVAAGTTIGRLMGNMRIGLMIGLVLAICIWTLITQHRAKAAPLPEGDEQPEEPAAGSDKSGTDE